MSLAPDVAARYFPRAQLSMRPTCRGCEHMCTNVTRSVLARTTSAALVLAVTGANGVAQAPTVQPTSFHFECGGVASHHATMLAPATVYSADKGYGFRAPLADAAGNSCAADSPFLFDVAIPEGNYDVTV